MTTMAASTMVGMSNIACNQFVEKKIDRTISDENQKPFKWIYKLVTNVVLFHLKYKKGVRN